MSVRESPRLYTLRANRPMTLDGSGSWVIRSGSVAVFAVFESEGGDRPRRLVFVLGAGEAILWSPMTDRDTVLLAVAIEEAQLEEISTDMLVQSAAAGDKLAASMIRMWAQRMQCDSIAESDEPAMAFSAAIASQKSLIHSLRNAEGLRQEEDRRLFAAREAFNDQLAHRAMADLSSNSARRSVEERSWEASPLLGAVRRVGEAIGLTIRAPMEGETTNDLMAILDASHVRSRSVLLTGRWWIKDAGPLIAYRVLPSGPEGNALRRPVALIPWRRSVFAPTRYRIYEGPAAGTPVDENAAAEIDPTAVALYAPLPESAETWELLKFAFRGRTRDCLTAVFCALASTLLAMLLPLASLVIFEHAVPDADRLMIVHIGFGLVAAAVGALLFDLAGSISVIRIEAYATSSLQSGLWDRLLRQGPSFFRKFTSGDLCSRAFTAAQLRQLLDESVLSTAFMAAVSLLNLILLFYYSASLALAALIIAVLAGGVSISCGVLIRKSVGPLQQLDAELLGLMVQLVNAVPKLRIAGAESRAFSEWGRVYSRRQRLRLRLQVLGDRIRLTGLITSPAALAILFWIAHSSQQSDSGGLTLGAFVAFNAAFGLFLAGATTLGDVTSTFLFSTNLWKRMSPILEEPPEIDDRQANPGVLEGAIVMDHVTFRYRDNGPLTLDGVSFHAEPGECIAVVGPSGSGKSTLISMLLKFETPDEGAIYFDSQDLNSLDIHAVRRQIGVVAQENKVMAGTVYENIVSSALATMDDAWEAARSGGLAEDIELMPMGMHTAISEGGGNISGGQRQRILIARALIQRPRILILDEATSALDNRTQAIVTQSLENLKVTRIIVAHRLSTIRNADRIYVMERGRIVQEGTFDKLFREEGLFRRLMERQMA